MIPQYSWPLPPSLKVDAARHSKIMLCLFKPWREASALSSDSAILVTLAD